MAQRGVGVLFDQENRGSLAFNFVDGFEDGMGHERRETERWFVEQQQSRIRHQRASHREHLLLAAGECSSLLRFTFPQSWKAGTLSGGECSSLLRFTFPQSWKHLERTLHVGRDLRR